MLQFVSWLAALAWTAFRHRMSVENFPTLPEMSARLRVISITEALLSAIEDRLMEREMYAWGGVKWTLPIAPRSFTIAQHAGALRRVHGDIVGPIGRG